MFNAAAETEFEVKANYKTIFNEGVFEPSDGFGRHFGDYRMAGSNPEPTKPDCGEFWKQMGCLNKDLHNSLRCFNPDLPKDSVYVKSVHHSCDNPLCPRCYRFGWAPRESGRIEFRLKEASKRFGLVEHIVDSIPYADYGLSLEDLRKKTVRILKARGVIGGVLIFHAFRYHRRNETYVGEKPHWFFSPHFHVLGFIGGEGYGKCRNCAFNPARVHNWDRCKGCNGFEGVTRKLYEKEGGRSGAGHIVKVLGKRKTVGGTAWYQLHHASVRRGSNSKKSHAATWFGVCSYRKLKLINGSDVGIKHKCPICASDLVRVRYLGSFSEMPLSRRGLVVPFYDSDGKPLWEIVASRKFEDG